jgi:MOSC domain-containing protein YiiM
MKPLARDHEGKAGVYGVVVAEGIIRPGDEVVLRD